RALGDDDVLGLEQIPQHLRHAVDSFHEDGIQLSSIADAATQVTAVCTRHRLFTGGVDFQHDQYVYPREHIHEVFEQVAGARVTMGLEDHHQPPLRPALAHRFNGHRHFTRMMAVVVHQHRMTITNRIIAVDLEAATHTEKVGKAGLNGFI